MRDCALRGYRDIQCSGFGDPPHHIISKRKLQGNREARAYVEEHADIFLVDLCRAHHGAVGHTKEGRRLLVLLKCELYGSDKVNEALEELRALYKVPPQDLRLEAILAMGG
jgi:hypothetical protein